MAEFFNVIFGDEQLLDNVKDYAQKRKVTVSRALQELSATGLRFHERAKNLNVDLLFEKNEKLKLLARLKEKDKR